MIPILTTKRIKLKSDLEFILNDKHGNFHILNVVGADEYAENVDNNAFTNGSVITLFKKVLAASKVLNDVVPARKVNKEHL